MVVLEAITHASRPLRLNELASLIQCICPSVKALSGFKTLIATCCGGLIEVIEDETSQVIHHSFTEFLRGDTRGIPSGQGFPVIHSDNAHKRLAINCLRYLQSGSLRLEAETGGPAAALSVTLGGPEHEKDTTRGTKREHDPFDYREARLLHPFLNYAVENWSWHASHYDIEDE